MTTKRKNWKRKKKQRDPTGSQQGQRLLLPFLQPLPGSRRPLEAAIVIAAAVVAVDAGGGDERARAGAFFPLLLWPTLRTTRYRRG